MSDSPIRAFHKVVQLFLGNAILAKGVIIGMNNHGAKSDDFVAMQDSDVFAIRRALQKRGKIDSGLGRRKRVVMRRYYDDIESSSSAVTARRSVFGHFLLNRSKSLVRRATGRSGSAGL